MQLNDVGPFSSPNFFDSCFEPEIQGTVTANSIDAKVTMQSHRIVESSPVPRTPHSEALNALDSWASASWLGEESDETYQELTPFTPAPMPANELAMAQLESVTTQTSNTRSPNRVIDPTGSANPYRKNSKRSRNDLEAKEPSKTAGRKQTKQLIGKQEINRSDMSINQYKHFAFKFISETETIEKIDEVLGGKITFLKAVESNATTIMPFKNYHLRPEWEVAIKNAFHSNSKNGAIKRVVDLFKHKYHTLPNCVITQSESTATSTQSDAINHESPANKPPHTETQDPPELNISNRNSLNEYAFLVIKHCLTIIGKDIRSTAKGDPKTATEEDHKIVAKMISRSTDFVANIITSPNFESLKNYRLREWGRNKIDTSLEGDAKNRLNSLNDAFKKKRFLYLEDDVRTLAPTNPTSAPIDSDITETGLPEYDLQLAEPARLTVAAYGDQGSTTAFSGFPTTPFYQTHLQPISYQISPETFNRAELNQQPPPFYYGEFNPFLYKQ